MARTRRGYRRELTGFKVEKTATFAPASQQDITQRKQLVTFKDTYGRD